MELVTKRPRENDVCYIYLDIYILFLAIVKQKDHQKGTQAKQQIVSNPDER